MPKKVGLHADKRLLVTGLERSGTSWLATILSRHPEIGMMFEHTGYAVNRMMGVRYAGNKLIAGRQIRYSQRASKAGYLVNRLVNGRISKEAYDVHRPFPTSKMSMRDYMDNGVAIIISRMEKDRLASQLKRTPITQEVAEMQADHAWGELQQLISEHGPDIILVTYEELKKHPVRVTDHILKRLGLYRGMAGTMVEDSYRWNKRYPDYMTSK